MTITFLTFAMRVNCGRMFTFERCIFSIRVKRLTAEGLNPWQLTLAKDPPSGSLTDM